MPIAPITNVLTDLSRTADREAAAAAAHDVARASHRFRLADVLRVAAAQYDAGELTDVDAREIIAGARALLVTQVDTRSFAAEPHRAFPELATQGGGH